MRVVFLFCLLTLYPVALAQTNTNAPRPQRRGIALHRSQAQPGPYFLHAGLESDLKSVSTTTKVGDAESKSGSGYYTLGAHGYYLLNQMVEVGGKIDWQEQSDKSKQGDKTITTTNTEYSFGPAVIANFYGDIQNDKMVFFGGGHVGYYSRSRSVDGGESNQSTSLSGYVAGLMIGMHYFVDTNVALTPQILVNYKSYSKDKTDYTDLETHYLNIAFSVFL